MAKIQIVTFLMTLLGCLHADNLLTHFQLCHRTDPDLNNCIKELVLSSRTHLANGMPELNIPPLEPLHLDKVLDAKPIDNSGNLILTLNDLNVSGCTDFSINNADLNITSHDLALDIVFKHLTFDGHYMLKGNYKGIDINANGRAKGNLLNLNTKVRIHYEILNHDGEEHVYVNNATVNTSIGGGNVKLENLFPKRKYLGKIASKIIERKFDKYAKAISPKMETLFTKLITDLSNNLFALYTYDEILPK